MGANQEEMGPGVTASGGLGLSRHMVMVQIT